MSAPAPDLSLYRPNVGVVLFNAEGLAWVGHRIGAAAPYDWQFPQGGVDDGEDLLTAARRELEEETGVRTTELLARTEGWITYDFPPEVLASGRGRGWVGQKQVWFAVRFTGDESEVRLDAHHKPEFDAWRWVILSDTPALVVPFKRRAYTQVVRAFAALSAE